MGKNLNHPGVTRALPVQLCEPVGGFEMRVVCPRRAVVGWRLADVLSTGSVSVGLFSGPFGGIPPVVEPAELLPAVIVSLVREIIQSIAQEMDIRAL